MYHKIDQFTISQPWLSVMQGQSEVIFNSYIAPSISFNKLGQTQWNTWYKIMKDLQIVQQHPLCISKHWHILLFYKIYNWFDGTSKQNKTSTMWWALHFKIFIEYKNMVSTLERELKCWMLHKRKPKWKLWTSWNGR